MGSRVTSERVIGIIYVIAIRANISGLDGTAVSGSEFSFMITRKVSLCVVSLLKRDERFYGKYSFSPSFPPLLMFSLVEYGLLLPSSYCLLSSDRQSPFLKA